MTKEQLAITLYGLFDHLWVKSAGVISKDESRALMEAAQFFQNEASVVAVIPPQSTSVEPTERTPQQVAREFDSMVRGGLIEIMMAAVDAPNDLRPMYRFPERTAGE